MRITGETFWTGLSIMTGVDPTGDVHPSDARLCRCDNGRCDYRGPYPHVRDDPLVSVTEKPEFLVGFLRWVMETEGVELARGDYNYGEEGTSFSMYCTEYSDDELEALAVRYLDERAVSAGMSAG